MKVVDRKTFLALPAGTIYCKGVHWAFDSICIKNDTAVDVDWWYLNPAWPAAQDSMQAIDILDESLRDGTSFQMEDAVGRDGMFDADAVFLIFEPADLKILREHIDRAITLGESQAGQPSTEQLAPLFTAESWPPEMEDLRQRLAARATTVAGQSMQFETSDPATAHAMREACALGKEVTLSCLRSDQPMIVTGYHETPTGATVFTLHPGIDLNWEPATPGEPHQEPQR